MPACFIIAEPKPVAIQCCGEFFDLFRIILYNKNYTALFTADGAFLKTNGRNGWRHQVGH